MAARLLDSDSLPLSRRPALLSQLPALLAFDPPGLYEKLLRLHLVRSREEGSVLFDEVKKYLVLSEIHSSRSIPMFSRRVDEAWHQFVLFTAQYSEFCTRFFGKFMHHEPLEAGSNDARRGTTFEQYRCLYEPLFGPISDAWYDEESLTLATRLVRARWKRALELRANGDSLEIVLLREAPVVLCAAHVRAEEALRFAMRGEPFHVRELPGLRDVDRVALCHALVRGGVLGVAP
jgi:hypothetical protein